MAMKRRAQREEEKKTAFDIVEEQDEQEQDTPAGVGVIGKLKSKISDYAGKQFKKTSVEMPEEVLHAWTVYCSTHRIKKRDHFLEILTKDLNKKMKG